MRLRQLGLVLPLSAVWLLIAWPAAAVIKVEMPVSKMYSTAKAVVIGAVESVTVEDHVVDVRVVEAAKGESPGERLRIQVLAPPGLVHNVVKGQPAVFFEGRPRDQPVAVVHLADTWLLANGVPNTPIWRVSQLYDGKSAFPGRTQALVRLIGELKAGKSPILDRVDQDFFRGGAKKIAKLDVQSPAWMLAADFAGRKRTDLVIGTARGVRLFLSEKDGYRDATDGWAAWKGPGGYHAAGDLNGDGRPDLLLDDTLWINEGGKFTAVPWRIELPANTRPLAAAILDARGQKRPDVWLLSADGQLRVLENPGTLDKPWPARPPQSLWKDAPAPAAAVLGDWGDTGKPHAVVVGGMGVMRYALDADGGPPADFTRLTGLEPGKSAQQHRAALTRGTALALDVNHDGRTDLLALSEAGGLLLINRGYGAFLFDKNSGEALAPDAKTPLGVDLPPATVWAAADVNGDGRDGLLV
ncbi:MAG: VCBS repeat-containing protein, partial [Thermoguttaceae bacterium]